MANNVGFSAARAALKVPADPVDQCTVGLNRPQRKEVVNSLHHNDFHNCDQAAQQGCEARDKKVRIEFEFIKICGLLVRFS